MSASFVRLSLSINTQWYFSGWTKTRNTTILCDKATASNAGGGPDSVCECCLLSWVCVYFFSENFLWFSLCLKIGQKPIWPPYVRLNAAIRSHRGTPRLRLIVKVRRSTVKARICSHKQYLQCGRAGKIWYACRTGKSARLGQLQQL